MLSNVAFSLRAVLAKKVMGDMEIVKGDSVANSTAVYAYTTFVTFLICLVVCIGVEGPRLGAGLNAAVAQVRFGPFKGADTCADFCHDIMSFETI